MKKQHLLLFVLTLFCSCYKANNPAIMNTPEFSIMAGSYYSGQGSIKDSTITFQTTDSTQLSISLSFTLLSGNPDNYPITCYLSNLPPGVSAVQDTFAFKLNKDVNFVLNVNTDTAVYPALVNVVTSSSGLKSYPIKIKVQPTPDCAPSLSGVYSGSDPCGHFSIGDQWYSYTATITTISGEPHWIAIRNFRGLGDSFVVNAFVYCGGTLDIPVQTVAGYTIWGRGQGSYSDDDTKTHISIFGDTLVHAGDTQTCYTQLQLN